MSGTDVPGFVSQLPYLPTLTRLALSVGCGVLVGLEREHHGKTGARTFGLTALLGCLGGLSDETYAVLSMAFVSVMVCFLNVRQFAISRTLGLTTSAALFIVGFAGVLCDQGHTFTPVAVSLISVALLEWKESISGFAVGLTDIELRSAILLAILSFIIYPILPVHPVDPFGLVELQTTWATVILIAALGFVNYVLWKIYGSRGVDIGSFLGGLVNSTAAVAELARRVKENGDKMIATCYLGVILATLAMLLRNSLLLAILAWRSLISSAVPMALMVVTSLLFVWRSLKSAPAGPEAPKLSLEQPFSLKSALKFGLLFLGLNIAGTLGQKYLGMFGFYAVSIAGGLLSSASAVAAAGTAAARHQVPVPIAANGAVLASLGSTLVDNPLVARVAGQPKLTARVTLAFTSIAGLGVAGVILHDFFRL